jgi:hypothetical protein
VQKRLQAIENIGSPTHCEAEESEILEPAGKTPGGNADIFENKGVVKKAIRKVMKTKG